VGRLADRGREGRVAVALARALHGTVEIDQEIPSEHYQAVAEIIGYVMRLNRAVGAGRA